MRDFLQFYKRLVNVIVLLCLLIFLIPPFFGYRLYAIETGSMEPSIPTGSLIYIHERKETSLKISDVITFEKEGDLVTHRIVGIDEVNHLFTTKGDALQYNDPYKTSIMDIKGKVEFSLPIIGYGLLFFKSFEGIIVGCFLLVLLIISMIKTSFERKKSHEED